LFGSPCVLAANYVDDFEDRPLGGGVYSDLVETGTSATGLKYVFTADGDGGDGEGFGITDRDADPVDVNYTLDVKGAGAGDQNTTERFTIESRDGKAFVFDDMWIDINPLTYGTGFTITGTGPEPFTITTGGPGSTDTYSPDGGSKLVTLVEVTSIDYLNDFFDDVDVELDVPGMDVQGNSTTIVNGDDTPTTADHTDFGSPPVGTPVTKTFTIRSIGDLALDLTGSPYVTFSSNPSGDFSVTAQPTTDPIASGGSDTFTIRCNPSGSGARTAPRSVSTTIPKRTRTRST